MPIGREEVQKLIEVIHHAVNERIDREVAAMRRDIKHKASRIVDSLTGEELRCRVRKRLEEDIHIDVTLARAPQEEEVNGKEKDTHTGCCDAVEGCQRRAIDPTGTHAGGVVWERVARVPDSRAAQYGFQCRGVPDADIMTPGAPQEEP